MNTLQRHGAALFVAAATLLPEMAAAQVMTIINCLGRPITFQYGIKDFSTGQLAWQDYTLAKDSQVDWNIDTALRNNNTGELAQQFRAPYWLDGSRFPEQFGWFGPTSAGNTVTRFYVLGSQIGIDGSGKRDCP